MFNTAISQLVEQFQQLPGVGEKTAQRLAFYMVKQGGKPQKKFSEVLAQLEEKIAYCPECKNFSDGDLCDICKSSKRNKEIVCIVEGPFDVLALEKTAAFEGVYHVLHGVLSPLDGVKPQDLTIDAFMKRIETESVQEIIFALTPSLEGEATVNYIKNLLPSGIPITQIARGLPSGASIEYADEITLSRALRDRRSLG